MIILVFLVSILMVSTIRYETMPNLNFKGSAKDKTKVILFMVGAILIIIFPQIVVFPFMVFYILTGIITWILRLNIENSSEKDSKVES